MKEQVTMNKMGTEPIAKLMAAMGLPMILSMMLQAFYNIVDSYFVSCMPGTGDAGVNALTLAFPIQMLMIAIGVGTGVGINAMLSKSLGMGDRKQASLIAGNAIFLGICTYIVFLLFGIFGVEAYIASQTSDPQIMEMSITYLRICVILSFGSILLMIYEKLLQATGRTTLSTIAQVVGAALNIILDPILIFGYFGFPEMGIAGAAYATVAGQIVSLILGMIFHHGFNKDVDSGLKYLRPRLQLIGRMYQIGIPAIIMQALMSIMTYSVNIIFAKLGTSIVTAYGMYYKIQQFVFFAAFGLNNAIIPIVAFNHGMKDNKRIRQGIGYGVLYTVIIMALGAIGLRLFSSQIIGVFDVSEEVKRLCIQAINIITLGYLFVGANVAFQGIFQALGHGIISLVISLTRLILIPIPLAWFMTQSAAAHNTIWSAFPIAEAAGFVVSLIAIIIIGKSMFKDRQEPSYD
ncbi:MAG: MATE family efflux transporter [Lachnospiraceae bacterium]